MRLTRGGARKGDQERSEAGRKPGEQCHRSQGKRVLQAGRNQREWLTGINAAENASELRTKIFLWI